MKHIKTAALACAIAMSAGAASAATLDFEGVFASPAQGLITGNEFAGVTISISGGPAGNPYKLGLYDSSCRANCTGGDQDLATGAGITGAPINAGMDTPAENYVLINAEGSGGSFGDRVGNPLFTFAYDVASVVKKFVLIDIDEMPASVQFLFHFADGSPIQSFDGAQVTTVINAGADNSWGEFDVAAIAANLGNTDFLKPVDKFQIQFMNNSGAIASVTVAAVPVPAALPLLAGGLGLLGWAARRRKAA